MVAASPSALWPSVRLRLPLLLLQLHFLPLLTECLIPGTWLLNFFRARARAPRKCRQCPSGVRRMAELQCLLTSTHPALSLPCRRPSLLALPRPQLDRHLPMESIHL